MPDSVHAQVTGRTCIVFLRPVLERTGGNVLKCEFKDLSSKPYGVVENSSPLADQLENVLVLFFVSTVRWRDNEFSGVASWEVRSQKAHFGPTASDVAVAR